MAGEAVPVLIVGGGPVGLATAIGLRRLGVECTLVERHPSTLDFPKGRRVTVRSMEILRSWGLEQDVVDISLPRAESLFVFRGETLFADDFIRLGLPVPEESAWSPTQEVICSQDLFEPLLRRRAQELGADLRFSTTLTSFVQGDDHVHAELEDANTGKRSTIDAAWVVAADGLRSGVRSALGVGTSGAGAIGERVSILIEADLGDRARDRLAAIYWLSQPQGGAALAAVDNKRKWLLMLAYEPEAEGQETFTDVRCAALARAALGDPAVEFSVLGVRFWQPTSQVADQFRVGCVFLAGDAAHVTTPLGGLGMNCGLADAHNLAWKLAGVIEGWADPSLLDTYESERQPIARATAEASLGPSRPPAPVDGLVLGYAYESSAVISDGTALPVYDNPIGDYAPLARPGHRAPHMWIDVDGARRSTLDVFGDGFAAMTNRPSTADAICEAARGTRIPLRSHVIDDGAWAELYGVGPGGAVLVRPDGHVAWRRVEPPESPDAFRTALLTAAGRA